MEDKSLTAEQLSKIKEYQRDFEEKYGKKLYISWPEMKGVQTRALQPLTIEEENYTVQSLEDLLQQCIDKYGASIEKIKDRSTRTHLAENAAERKAIQDYCKLVVTNRFNVRKAAQLINRDRSIVYHFATYVNVRNERKMQKLQ